MTHPPAPPEHDGRRALRVVAGRDTEGRLGIASLLCPGWWLSVLPRNRTPDGELWRVRDGDAALIVVPGRRVRPGSGDHGPTGVPYGATARLVMIYLQTQALRTGARRISLGGMEAWFDGLGQSSDGTDHEAVRDQVERIAMASFSFHAERGELDAYRNAGFVDRGWLLTDGRTNNLQRPPLFDVVELSRPFYGALRDHPVLLDEQVLRQLRASPLAIDLYAWLALGLRSLSFPTPVGWAALHARFGWDHARRAVFRAAFRQALNEVLAVYPEAANGGVQEVADGLVLYPTTLSAPGRAT